MTGQVSLPGPADDGLVIQAKEIGGALGRHGLGRWGQMDGGHLLAAHR